MEKNRLQQLIESLVEHRLTAQEEQELNTILLNSDAAQITGEVTALVPDGPVAPFDESLLPIAARAMAVDKRMVEVESNPGRVHFLRTAWFRYAAAVLLILGVGAYLWNNYSGKENSTIITQQVTDSTIAPGGNKAVLILGDESILNLDSLQAGQAITQGNMQVIKSADGELLYVPLNNADGASDAVFINTMKTPRGGQYQLTLPDGSQVWLNAASSITYPTRFKGAERGVTVSGEVYFEIAKDAAKPFIVRTSTDQITVLGTSFNVNSYTDEPAGKISLLEGRVKVGEVVLKPGEAYTKGKVLATNVQQDVAWKNGVFDFSSATVPVVMRQLARWYDLEIVYENNQVPGLRLQGSMSRDLPLSGVLKGLAVVGVRCRMENGRRLVVLEN